MQQSLMLWAYDNVHVCLYLHESLIGHFARPSTIKGDLSLVHYPVYIVGALWKASQFSLGNMGPWLDVIGLCFIG